MQLGHICNNFQIDQETVRCWWQTSWPDTWKKVCHLDGKIAPTVKSCNLKFWCHWALIGKIAPIAKSSFETLERQANSPLRLQPWRLERLKTNLERERVGGTSKFKIRWPGEIFKLVPAISLLFKTCAKNKLWEIIQLKRQEAFLSGQNSVDEKYMLSLMVKYEHVGFSVVCHRVN